MSLKFALLGLPYGGAVGGIACDPSRLSAKELKSLLAGYVSAFAPLIGAGKDVISPETGLGARERGWLLDAISKQTNASPNNALVGKSPDLFGWNFYDQSIPFGAFCVLRKFLATQNKPLQTTKIAIQGFGTVGRHMARLLEDQNATILALSEKNSAIYCSSGIDIEEAGKYYQDNGTLEDLPDCESISNEELLTCECEVLMPCAAEDVIDAEIAPQIQAHTIVEAANAPIGPEADEILFENGVTILPDVLSSAGEALAGHYELMGRTNAEDFQKTLEQAFEGVNAKADQMDCDYRAAAYAMAIERLVKAMKAKM
jgi:glutamate dehydrogenase/leucine dehydrogenase